MEQRSFWRIDLKNGCFFADCGTQAFQVSGVSDDFVHLIGPYTSDPHPRALMERVAQICFKLEEIFEGKTVMWGVQATTGMTGTVLGEEIYWTLNLSARTLWLAPFASKRMIAQEWEVETANRIVHKAGLTVSFDETRSSLQRRATWALSWKNSGAQDKWARSLSNANTLAIANAARVALSRLTS